VWSLPEQPARARLKLRASFRPACLLFCARNTPVLSTAAALAWDQVPKLLLAAQLTRARELRTNYLLDLLRRPRIAQESRRKSSPGLSQLLVTVTLNALTCGDGAQPSQLPDANAQVGPFRLVRIE
jgi:hypothetical protein